MKTKMTLFTLCGFLALFGVSGCRGQKSSSTPGFSFTVSLESGKTSLNVTDKDKLIVTPRDSSDTTARSYTATSSNTSVLSVDENLEVSALTVGETTVTVTESVSQVKSTLKLTVQDASPATGTFAYTNVSYAEKAEILGKLEGYAVDNFLTGIPLFENGGTVMYNPRVKKGTETYISSYGFGILSEGSITEPLEAEALEKYKLYYHAATSQDPKGVNALNDKGSLMSDFYDYCVSSYWGAKMNATKDGFEWYSVLAKEMPQAVNPDAYGYSDTWRFRVNLGSDGLKYSTLSTVYSKYNGREVTIDDYLFAFKALLNQNVAYVRGSELVSSSNSTQIYGAAKYYNATKDVTIDSDQVDKLFEDNVWVKKVESVEGSGVYDSLEIRLTKSVNQFYAMYNLNSNFYSPLCKDFFLEIGSTAYGGFDQAKSTNPVDNMLCLSPYTLEYWEENKLICYKRNPDWFEFKSSDPTIANRYSIAGVHYDIITAAQTDSLAIFNEFIAGKLDAAAIPLAKVKAYKNDPRTTTTKGSSTFKLNVNACTEEMWEYLFGEKGTVTRTKKADYWDVKPWMSNQNFLMGLYTSIDRQTYADNRGVVPSQNFFASSYLIDPENGVAYNDTDAHKAVIENYFPETYGYNLEAATLYFQTAVEELVEAGDLELGTESNPTKISIVIEWMNPDDPEEYGNEIGSYIEAAFNNKAVCGGAVQLSVIQHEGTTDYTDVYYKHLMVGQFDLGFGSISGNTFDPLNFLNVLFSDNSSGFTLNWGPDTSEVSSSLAYDGKTWSFESLWTASNVGGVFENGYSINPVSAELKEIIDNTGTDGSIVVKIDYACVENENTSYEFDKLDFYIIGVGNITFEKDVDYTIDETNKEIVLTLTADTLTYLSAYLNYYYGVTFDFTYYGLAFEFEIYFNVSFCGLMPQSVYGTVENLPVE